MSFGTTTSDILYVGNDTDDTFAIPFNFAATNTIGVKQFNIASGSPVSVPLTLNVDYTVDLALAEVTLAVPLPVNHRLYIYRETHDWNEDTYATYQFPYTAVNVHMDKIFRRLQELETLIGKSLLLSDGAIANGDAATGDDFLVAQETIDDHETRITSLEETDITLREEFEELRNNVGGGTLSTYDGFSARYGEYFGPDLTLNETLLQILDFSYLAPQVSLSGSVSTSIREKGTLTGPVTLSATTTRRTNDITLVDYYRNGVLINTEAAPVATGTVETYADSATFTDTTSFTARAGDGTSNTTSNTLTYSFVYPYYYGAAAPGRTPTQVAALTKSVIASTASLNRTFTSSNGDVYYYAYPASYGPLTSILDENGFETFSDWTLTTANITGLDLSAVSYRIYAFNNPVVAGSTNYTFIR